MCSWTVQQFSVLIDYSFSLCVELFIQFTQRLTIISMTVQHSELFELFMNSSTQRVTIVSLCVCVMTVQQFSELYWIVSLCLCYEQTVQYFVLTKVSLCVVLWTVQQFKVFCIEYSFTLCVFMNSSTVQRE